MDIVKAKLTSDGKYHYFTYDWQGTRREILNASDQSLKSQGIDPASVQEIQDKDLTGSSGGNIDIGQLQPFMQQQTQSKQADQNARALAAKDIGKNLKGGPTVDGSGRPNPASQGSSGGLSSTGGPPSGLQMPSGYSASSPQSPQGGPTGASTGASSGGLQAPKFYKPGPNDQGYDPNNPQAVYDSTGKILSHDEYLKAGGAPDYSNLTAGSVPQAGGAGTITDVHIPAGIPEDVWKNTSPAMQSAINAIWAVISKQQELGKQVPTALTAQDLADLWKKAEADPTINKTFANEMAMGKQDFFQNLQTLKDAYGVNQIQQKLQFDQQKEALDKATQQAGQAYSGFRQKNEQNLATQQQSVITSGLSDLNKNVSTLGSQFERQYGSAALQGAGGVSVGGQSYTPLGGIAGATETEKLGNTETKYQDLIKNTQLQRGVLQ